MNEQEHSQQPEFYTGFYCDRCSSFNAIRYQIAVKKDFNSTTKEDIDLCHRCVVAMGGMLLNRLPLEERPRWIKSFIQGIIR